MYGYATYKRALDVSPKHAAALANSGCAHAEMGHGEKALDFLDAAVKADGDFAKNA